MNQGISGHRRFGRVAAELRAADPKPKTAAQSRTLAGAGASTVARCSWSNSVRLIYFVFLT
jgi:hypothetical protein